MTRAMPPAAPGCAARGRPRRDRGAATLELAVLAPAVVLLTFGIVQAALVGYARSLAQAAAVAGVTAGRCADAPPRTGTARARAFLADQARDTVRDPTVTDTGTTTRTVRITVSGRSVSVIPGIAGFTVQATAHGPREHFTTPGAP
jgi:hypothetical protein